MAIKRVGLDIGATCVRVAEVEFSNATAAATGTGTLVGFAESPLPRGAVQGGEVVDVGIVTAAIKKVIGDASVATKEVAIGVGAESVVVRELEVPEMPMAQLRTSLPFQVQELLPMSASEAMLDFFPTGQHDKQGTSMLRGILVAAPKATISQNLLAVEGAGLRPVRVDVNGFALLRAQFAGDAGARVAAFVDVGATLTTVVVSQAGMPRLLRTLPSGGQAVTDAVAAALHIDQAQAEEVKRQIGLGQAPDASWQPAQEAILATTRNLVESIRNTFVYHSSNNPGEAIERVSITGGGSHLPGLGQYLASATRLPVSYGNSFARVQVGKKVSADATRGHEARAPIAVGLAFGEAA